MLGTLRALARDIRAGTAIEYGLICSLIVVAMLAALIAFASVAVGIWDDVAAKVSAVT